MARSLLNRAAVKETTLELAEQRRPGRFTQVSNDFLTALEAHVRTYIADELSMLPSMGKTIYPSTRR
jgi:hypothetical protein